MGTNIKTYRFAFIGNCQIAGLCQYISWLPFESQSYWLCRNVWLNYPWAKSIKVFGEEQIGRHVFDKNKRKEILQTCDIIIYQPNFDTLNMLHMHCNPNQTKISISPIYVNDMQFMTNKETKYNTTIKVSNIIKDHKDKKLYLTDHDNHPTSFLLLEIVKKICDTLKLPFYNKNVYNKLLLNQYPNYS